MMQPYQNDMNEDNMYRQQVIFPYWYWWYVFPPMPPRPPFYGPRPPHYMPPRPRPMPREEIEEREYR